MATPEDHPNPISSQQIKNIYGKLNPDPIQDAPVDRVNPKLPSQASDSNSHPDPQPESLQAPAVLFDPDLMQQVRQDLETDYGAIQSRYQAQQETIKKLKLEKLELEFLTVGQWTGMTRNSYIITIVICLALMIPGIWVLLSGAWWFWNLIAILWCGVLGLGIIGTLDCPILTPAQAQRLKPIREEIEALEQQAKQEFEREQKAFQQQAQAQVAYFVALPPETLTPEFLAQLTPKQQFYCLKALQERQDRAKLQQQLKLGAKVIVGVGLLAAIFTGLPFL